MRISGHTAVYGVVGRPVRHSRSPSLHNAWFDAHGIDAVYTAFDVDPARADGVAAAIRTLGLAGANLTVPFKQAVVPHLDEVVGLAAVLGAVNTVVHRDGRLLGYNTDAEGFTAGLIAAYGDVVRGRRAVVLGAGGAGLAVGAGLAQAGAAEVIWLNRSQARATQAVATCAAAWPSVRFAAGTLDASGFEAVRDAAVIVQATSGSAKDRVAALPADRVPANAVWSDLNYWDDDPPLAGILADRGVRVQDGWPMLVHQAALAFAHFTGISPDAASAVSQLRKTARRLEGSMTDRPALVCKTGSLEGQVIPVDEGGLEIGRSPENDLVLEDDGVSRFHARLLFDNGSLWLRDAGSRNGVEVNGQRIADHRALKVGDVISLGDCSFEVRWASELLAESGDAAQDEAAQPNKPTAKRRWYWPFE